MSESKASIAQRKRDEYMFALEARVTELEKRASCAEAECGVLLQKNASAEARVAMLEDEVKKWKRTDSLLVQKAEARVAELEAAQDCNDHALRIERLVKANAALQAERDALRKKVAELESVQRGMNLFYNENVKRGSFFGCRVSDVADAAYASGYIQGQAERDAVIAENKQLREAAVEHFCSCCEKRIGSPLCVTCEEECALDQESD